MGLTSLFLFFAGLQFLSILMWIGVFNYFLKKKREESIIAENRYFLKLYKVLTKVYKK